MASRTLKNAELNHTTTEKELLAIVWALIKFRTFIQGTDLTIITDHKAITFLLSSKLITGRLARWILVLQSFTFKIDHYCGVDNVVSDTLSRYPMQDNGDLVMPVNIDKEFLVAEACATTMDKSLKSKFKNLKLLQDQDEMICKTKVALNSPAHVNNTKMKLRYMLHNGILFFRNRPDVNWKVMLPTTMIPDVVWDVHKQLGHFGVSKCCYMLGQTFYWVNMTRTVKQILSTCDLCQRTKCSVYKLQGEFNSILPVEKGEIVTTDIYGPLPKGQLGVQFVLVFIDNFTKHVKLYVMRNATAKCVVSKLEQYLKHIQKPRAILADHGTQYTSNVWVKALEANNVKVMYSSVRHPQSNPTERVMRELGRMFRTYCRKKHTTWYNHLSLIEDFLNITMHDSTGFTPLELQYGINPQCRIK